MSTQLDQIRDQQQAAWDKFSVGWKKWDALVLNWLAPVGAEMIEGARLHANSQVLDIASGTGEPALSIAVKCPQGKVMMTDLAEKMLVVAKENASRRGLRNVEARQCDAGVLPFADAMFDAVTARFGFMFFPDIPATARELARVAKPGARLCAAVWGEPAKNPWATTVLGAIAKHVDMPPPPPGAPGLFRCAAAGYMVGVFREAGLKNVTEKEVSGHLPFESSDEYFTFMNEVVAPVVAGMAKADDPTRARIRSMVAEIAAKTGTGGRVLFDWSATVICGEK
jgi:ubiquinone/menaquinone biosynthesis C-methylase UbiE